VVELERLDEEPGVELQLQLVVLVLELVENSTIILRSSGATKSVKNKQQN